MNYGCPVSTVSSEAAVKFANNVNAAKNSANTQISNIKANKKVQYDAYVAYQAWLAEQQRLAAQRAAIAQAEQLVKAVQMVIQSLFGIGNSIVGSQSNNFAWMNRPTAGLDENSAYAYLWESGAQGQYGFASGDASIYAGIEFNSRFALYDNKEKFAPGVLLDARAKATLLMGEINGLLGTDTIDLILSGEGDFGTVQAGGNFRLGFDNDGKFQANVEGDLLAAAATGEISGEIDVFGLFRIGAKAEGYVGDAGATGKAGYFEENGRHGFKIGGSLAGLFGGGFEFDISW